MTLEIDDDEIDAMAEQLSERRGMSKEDAVRLALRNELDRDAGVSDRVTQVMDFLRDFHARHPPTGLKADKAFIDSLYED